MRIAIAGYGLEGKSNLKYFRAKYPDARFTVFDESESIMDLPANVETVLGRGAFSKIENFDLVVRTAGLAPSKIAQINKRTSSTKEFFEQCPAPIIGVTGSKGKGTTCSYIANILREHKKVVHLVGNIGTPALEVIEHIKPEDIVVYELSSFQLWDLDQSPSTAVITLIEPDHLDVHDSLEDYIKAKFNIIKYQTEYDRVVYNEQDNLVRESVVITAKRTNAQLIPFVNNRFVHFDQNNFFYNDEIICPVNAVKIPGEHNKRNAAAAISATWSFINGDTDAIRAGIEAFDGLEHRLKFVGEVRGTQFYDDSIATTPGSAVAAIKSFSNPKRLIVGGHDKGADYTELGKELEGSGVIKVYAIGANAEKVKKQIESSSTVETEEISLNNMSDIVKRVFSESCPGEIIILSPAAASFDMFKNYQDRGEQFINAVKSL